MPATLIGWVHFVLALAAIAVGAVITLSRKATSRHRRMGQTYGFLMLGLNITAFMIYGLFGRFGPFHLAALVSLATVVPGWVAVRRRSHAHWVEAHASLMSWSYVGLLAAAAAETLSRIPETPFWGTVVGASLAVLAAGAVVIRRRLPPLLAPFRRGGG